MIKKELLTQMSEKEKFLFIINLRETLYAAKCCFHYGDDEDLEYFEEKGRPLYEKLKKIFS